MTDVAAPAHLETAGAIALRQAITKELNRTYKLSNGSFVTGRSSYALTGTLRCDGHSIPGSDKNIGKLLTALGFTIGVTLSGEPIVYIA